MKQVLAIPVLALLFPSAVFADLNQTNTLSTSNQTNLNLDTGVVASSGGDIQFSGAGMAPQGAATIGNIYSTWPLAQFNTISVLILSLDPALFSTTPIPASKLTVGDVFGVHTNGGHWAKLIVVANTGATITLQSTTFGAAAGGSGNTTGPPTITSIRNNSSGIAPGLPNYGITPSSIFAIVGTNLADPGTPVLQSSATPGLPSTLNGASLSVTVNGVIVHPAIYYTSPTQIAAVLPANTPVGTGTLIVTYKGVPSNAAPLVVVPAALGINTYYANSAVATDAVTGALLGFTNSGTPGENIVLWTTGLGADPADSDSTYTSTPHAVNTSLQIYIGGALATILYQGSAGYPGVNQINVTIPASTPSGCWISVAAVAGGLVSNTASIPVTSTGGQCVDPVNGLTGSQILPAGSQNIRTGVVVLGQTVSPSKGVNVTNTFTDAAFESYAGIYAADTSLSPGGCIVNPLVPASIGASTGLDPGTIGMTGPNALSLTMVNQLGIKGAFIGTIASGAIPTSGGTFTVTGSGGADVGPFTSVLNFSNPILGWTNQAIASTVDRTKDITAVWTGGNPGSYVFITGSSTSTATSTTPSVSSGFTCLAHSDDGQFTVPSYILSALPPGSGGFGIQNDIYVKMPATGLDIGFVQGEIGISTTTTYK